MFFYPFTFQLLKADEQPGIRNLFLNSFLLFEKRDSLLLSTGSSSGSRVVGKVGERTARLNGEKETGNRVSARQKTVL